MEFLFDRLAQYQKEDIYPMHMPGHKRNTDMFSMPNPYSMDITEIEGFDNLHEAEGIIKESVERARALYQADHTYYLVNGSTVGLLAGIMACTNKHDHVLVARNCHKAVYNALFLNELKPVYLYPSFNEEFGCYEQVPSSLVKEKLEENKEVRLVILTSPTYEGVVSDIQAIAEICHERGIPLLVDEAHGAHFGLDPYFPESAVKLGADVVIQSIHKTMPAFTQTALLHSREGLVNQERLKDYLSILQSSSPSYLLMAGIDRCITYTSENKELLFAEYKENLTDFYKQMKQLKHLRLYEHPSTEGVLKDPSKLVIGVGKTSLSAEGLYECLLHDYKIQLEMISKEYGIAMTSFCDRKEGYERLAAALLAIDASIDTVPSENGYTPYDIPAVTQKKYAYEAIHAEYETVSLTKAAGRISAEYLYFYPPGIPIVVPGEELSEQLLEGIKEYKKAGISVRGLKDASLKTIRVVKEHRSE